MNTVIKYSSSDFVHKILLPKKQHNWQADQWCREQFGPRWEAISNKSGTWCCFWRGLRESDKAMYEWLFVNEADAMWFKLRWS